MSEWKFKHYKTSVCFSHHGTLSYWYSHEFICLIFVLCMSILLWCLCCVCVLVWSHACVCKCVCVFVYEVFSKTKEMCIDLRKNQRCPKPVHIKGEAVERVHTYKYLGVVFGSKLNWKENINSVLKKVNSRMYCMRKPRSFGVNSATGVDDFYFREQIQTIIKPRFYPRLCQFLMKIIPVKTSAELRITF